jgi:hypothetical protein
MLFLLVNKLRIRVVPHVGGHVRHDVPERVERPQHEIGEESGQNDENCLHWKCHFFV